MEFLNTLKAALIKVDGLEFWTLAAEQPINDSKIGVLCEIIQQKMDEIDDNIPKLAQSKST